MDVSICGEGPDAVAFISNGDKPEIWITLSKKRWIQLGRPETMKVKLS